MLKLNFTLFKGMEYLRDWWKQVRENFTAIEDAHNALEAALGEEIAERAQDRQEIEESIGRESLARQNAESALGDLIRAEKKSREAADAVMERSHTEKAELLSAEITKSASDVLAKLASDKAALEQKINAEGDARKNGDRELESTITYLREKSHEHSNLSVINDITSDDISLIRDKSELIRENASLIDYLEDVCRGINGSIKELYGASGVMLYDGGTDGELTAGIPLDGGDFDDEEQTSVDCGTFDILPFAAAAVIDGGQY